MVKVLAILTAGFAALSAVFGTILGCLLFVKFVKKTLELKDTLLSKQQ